MHFKALCDVLALPLPKPGPLTKTYPTRIPIKARAVGKMLMIMKLTTIILFATCLQVAAAGYSQQVTLSEKDAPLEKVIESIKKQTGYLFFYNFEWLRKAEKVSVQVKNAPIEKALDLVFKNQPFTYSIVNNIIVLKEKKEVRVIGEAAKTPEPVADITGFIYGDNNTRVAGANIIVKRTGKGTITKENGEFKLSDVNEDDILIISALGYKREEVAVKDFKNGYVVVQLKLSPEKLDEVRVLAYGGATTRRLATGNSSRITAEDIAKQPVNNPLQALAGRVAGLSINQASGLAGGEVNFEIRGRNSLQNDGYLSAPLVIVDGVPFPNVPVTHPSVIGKSDYLGGGSGPIGYGNPLYNLNPNDIESIEILKDADATAIYGSRAGNGVMLITTKKGKQGKTKIDLNVNTGIALNTRRVDVLSTPEYLALRREAFKNAGLTPTALNAPDLITWDSTKDADWQKELTGNTAHITDVNLTMSGGAGGTTFLVSGNYHKENTIFPDRRGLSKSGAHFSLNHASASGKFNASLSGMVNFTNTKMPNASDAGGYAYRTPPNFEPYDSLGKLKWDWGTSVYDALNPYSSLKTSYVNKSFTFSSNLLLRYTILPGLDAKAAIGYTRMEADEQYITPKAALNADYPFASSSNQLSVNRSQTVNFEPQLQYVRPLAGGTLNVMAGSTFMKNAGEMPLTVSAYDFASDAYINNLSAATTLYTYTSYTAYQYASVFGRANYNWQNRYIINGSFRRDGSSRFGPGRRFGNFGAVGAAWLFTNESFAKKMSFVSFGKLRGSIGWVGSDNVSSNYQYLSLYRSSGYPYTGTVGVVPVSLVDPNFGWESTSKLEGALELGFVNNRVLLTAVWYQNRTGNQLVGYPVSTQTGFNSFTANLNSAVVQNTGWEIELNTVNITNKNFKWATSFNMTIPNNKLLKFEGIEKTSYASTMQVGKSLMSNFAVHYLGVDSAGTPQYEDANKNGTTDFLELSVYGKGDQVYAGKSFADYYGGLTNTLNYKNFQLDFTFQYTYGLQKRNYISYLGGTPGGFYNVPRKAVEDLRAAGLASYFFKPANWDFLYYSLLSDATLMDASFIRLTNAAFSYNLPEKFLKPLRLGSFRTYVQAQNLFVISNYDGYDPETGATNVPPLFRITAGIQCTF